MKLSSIKPENVYIQTLPNVHIVGITKLTRYENVGKAN